MRFEPIRTGWNRHFLSNTLNGWKRVIGIGREVQGVRRDGSVFPLDIAVSEWTSFGRKRFTGIIRDLSEKSTLVARLNGQYRVLDKLVHECSLGEVLRTLVEASEAAQPGMTASILLLDQKKQTLRHGASTSLPEFYVKAIDGVAIGPDVGSCGTAAFTAHRVIVEDIQSHPFWRNYKDIAKQASLGSCWSEPIISTNGSVLGTFAMYYREPHIPEDGDLEFASSFAHLAAVAIERTQTITTQQRMAAIIESTDDAVLSRNLDGLVESWNKGAERLFGYTAAEIIGKPICLLVPEDRTQELLNLRDCLNRNERVDHFETIRITKSGDRIEVSLTSSPIYDTEGSVIAFSTIARDISDRRRAEQALREKQDTLIMLDATEIISWEIDLVTNQSSWNNRYTKVFGARDDVDSRWWRERIHPDDRERVTSSFVAALEGDCNIWKDEYRFRRADGSYAVLLDHAYFSRNESGKAIRVTGAKFDVTESKQLKAKLLASERLADW